MGNPFIAQKPVDSENPFDKPRVEETIPLVFKKLKDVADFFEVKYATVEYWRQKDNMPGAPGNWNIREIMRWLVNRRRGSINIVEIVEKKDSDAAPPVIDPADVAEISASFDIDEGSFDSVDDLDTGFGAVFTQKKYRAMNERLKFEIQELVLAERRGVLVRREILESWLREVASVIRRFGDTLEKKFGPDAADLHATMCDQIEERIPKEKDPMAN